ncbi:DUF5753 domain-containing protein [Nocardiopsis baichengensis]|uniref:DUF5753 domain-containing protein n=1 Tax=Nocardiopsis baichengensis TaxID=280240 RepID=UPI00036F3EFB|nr:DUF5753 domain-containing protein [Nocardiopsis baichengensis]
MHAGQPWWERAVVTDAVVIVMLEQRAAEIREYHTVPIPGLLQTSAYTRALAIAGRPSRTPEEIEGVVEGRRRRQEILGRQQPAPPLLLVVLDEMVIRRPVGGRRTMADQLERILDVESEARVTVQIVPYRTEQHPGLAGAFRLVRADDGTDVLYLEHAQAGILIQDSADLKEFSERFADLRGVALPPPESRKLIEEIRGEFR